MIFISWQSSVSINVIVSEPDESMWTLNGSVYFDVGLQERTVAGQVSIFIPHVFNYTHLITLGPQSSVHNFSVDIPTVIFTYLINIWLYMCVHV